MYRKKHFFKRNMYLESPCCKSMVKILCRRIAKYFLCRSTEVIHLALCKKPSGRILRAVHCLSPDGALPFRLSYTSHIKEEGASAVFWPSQQHIHVHICSTNKYVLNSACDESWVGARNNRTLRFWCSANYCWKMYMLDIPQIIQKEKDEMLVAAEQVRWKQYFSVLFSSLWGCRDKKK